MDTLAPATPALDRDLLTQWYLRNRARSAEIFGLVRPEAFFDRPIPLRHPFVFYEGHIPAFSFLTLNERALGEAPLDSRLEKMFERGIDPGTVDEATRHSRADWPSREEVAAFGSACDASVLQALGHARLEDSSVPRLVRAEAAYTILEHEPMHHETLMYIIHRLPFDRKNFVAQTHRDESAGPNRMRTVSGGIATLGSDRDAIPFGWDNEFSRTEIAVPEFDMQQFPVTNGDYLEFVRDGGPAPPFWIERDGLWILLAAFEELPLPMSWPVYVSHDQATAYANWKNMRIATEAQYHRAAFATPTGAERAFPWGSDAPTSFYGNFDFARYDPEPVAAHAAGASAWDIWDLIGNGWEWTSTPFAPLHGFEPMASYPQYSADFFDGKHFVMKGASPVTARELVRRTFRNWFYGDYPYMYAKFRCVA
ncbi:MAG: SUMF1/EgtB/PvdO family nonheme iron enzyme [Candidatus Eremiobacteraeota bacterium]|nr:SUMF1/EgtB/PvdO family nonheme iron enzyme [Candidatus Eremiobacteraeota bacterium]